MARKGQMPESIFIAPSGRCKEKEKHRYALFAVEEWDERGIPFRFRLIRDDEIINIADAIKVGVKFLTAYVPAIIFTDNPENTNRKSEPLQRVTKSIDK